MHFSTFAAVAALASSAVVSAQTDHKIVVGGTAGLVFTPSTVVAAQGDTVTFEFQSKNHTVTQSAFANPCQMLVNATTNQQGFNSGFVPVAANATAFPAWTLQVTNASAPIWFFCMQSGHCQQGMVGAINAPTTGAKTFDAFKALAMGASANATTPGGSGTTNGAGVGASASGTVAGAVPGATGGPNTSGASVKVASTGLSLGMVAAALFLFA